jgi:hypothetical protein
MSTTKVSAAMQDLTDDYAFSGTVSGAGTEGDEIFTLAITPTNASNKLHIHVELQGGRSVASWFTLALFQDSTAGALASQTSLVSLVDAGTHVSLVYFMSAGTTSATTFKVRAGANNAGTHSINGNAGARLHGGVHTSSMTIMEIAV